VNYLLATNVVADVLIAATASTYSFIVVYPERA